MKAAWEIFEEMNEMVYVSNIETNEIIYMNQYLRDALGYDTHSEYRGKKCYEILHGQEKPCSFCNNKDLKYKKYIAWTYKNPVLNKRLLVKNSLINENGNKYRIEIAIDADGEDEIQPSLYYTRSEKMLIDCLQQSLNYANPEESINNMLLYIGRTFLCDRVYIFEINDRNTADNTYEWCNENVTAQRVLLQNVPVSVIAWWIDLFKANQAIVIDDLEDIRTKYPEAYAILKPQNISTLAAGPIKASGKIIGFIGVDNPDSNLLPLIKSLLKVIGFFISSLLRSRDLNNRLNKLSYHDQLTGALNRNALSEYYDCMSMKTVGVLYFDTMGLKNINDTYGHEAGDRMIRHCYEIINATVPSELIFRTGGDEFVTLCSDIRKDDFEDIINHLKEIIREDSYPMMMGYAWSDDPELNLEKLIAQADQVMYENKRNYYQKYDQTGVDRRRSREAKDVRSTVKSSFQKFLDMSYCNIEYLFKSVAADNESSYFYFGDMQKDLFYISDNMRDDFGFKDNIVSGLLTLWENRISSPESKKQFKQDISDMINKKRTIHDLCYRVTDAKGNNRWIRCYGHLEWNEDRTIPIFFSGRITCQDMNFVVDAISNFLREKALFNELNKLKEEQKSTVLIGFILREMNTIGGIKGIRYEEGLVRSIANSLNEKMSRKVSFYCMEGMVFVALIKPEYMEEDYQSLLFQIKEIVDQHYEQRGILVSPSCSFSVMRYPYNDLEPEDAIDDLISMVRLAKQETEKDYLMYSSDVAKMIKENSEMSFTLQENVMHNMENFRVVIQPVVSPKKEKIVGGEVLLRWSFKGHDVSPMEFIPLLEKNNLIQTVGRWVFEQTVANCMRLRSYDPKFYLTFNVSLHQLSDDGLIPFMKEVLDKYHLDGSGIVAELTESCFDENPEKLIYFIDECQKLGLRIALDDFGSGYSSFRMLLHYQYEIIKLDRSLIQEAMDSEEKYNFICSIVMACHQFGKKVCIEGVEREEQDKIARTMGCDMIQGFYYFRPMELSDVYKFIAKSDTVLLGK